MPLASDSAQRSGSSNRLGHQTAWTEHSAAGALLVVGFSQVQNLANLGAMLLMETGSPDVAFARCRALSWACEKLREYPDRDVVLMLDDDMEVPAETAQALTDQARQLGRACSAVYATLTAKVAASRWVDHPPGLWLVSNPMEDPQMTYIRLG